MRRIANRVVQLVVFSILRMIQRRRHDQQRISKSPKRLLPTIFADYVRKAIVSVFGAKGALPKPATMGAPENPAPFEIRLTNNRPRHVRGERRRNQAASRCARKGR